MGFLLMLMTIGGLTAAAVLFVTALITNKTWLTRFVFGGVIVWFTFYFVVLLAYSFSSKEKNLALNEPKEFCGFYFDCHMHTAVAGVRRTKTIGNKTANGEFYIVRVSVFSNAVKATLGLTTVDTHVVDRENRRYTRDTEAESQMPPQPPFEKQIGPEESFEKEIVFDLPVDVKDPRLDIAEGLGIDKVIESVMVGDEDSILHARTYFKLLEHNQFAGVK